MRTLPYVLTPTYSNLCSICVIAGNYHKWNYNHGNHQKNNHVCGTQTIIKNETSFFLIHVVLNSKFRVKQAVIHCLKFKKWFIRDIWYFNYMFLGPNFYISISISYVNRGLLLESNRFKTEQFNQKTGRRLIQFPLTFDGTSLSLKHIWKAFCNQQYWLSLRFSRTYYFAWIGQKQKRILFMRLEHKSVVFHTYINDLRVHANETW